MLYGDIKDLHKYFGISKNLDTALRFLAESDLTKLNTGRNEVDGDDVFVSRFDYETLPEPECIFEAHEKYADIHVLLSGSEKIALAAPEALTETGRDFTSDFIGYKGEAEAICVMESGKFLIALPNEPHMVKMQNAGKCTVQKAVFKVKMN